MKKSFFIISATLLSCTSLFSHPGHLNEKLHLSDNLAPVIIIWALALSMFYFAFRSMKAEAK